MRTPAVVQGSSRFTGVKRVRVVTRPTLDDALEDHLHVVTGLDVRRARRPGVGDIAQFERHDAGVEGDEFPR